MKVTTEEGAWVVAIHKVISRWNLDDASFDPLEAIITAGRAADLFSATRSLGAIKSDVFEKYRKLSLLKPSQAKTVLKVAEAAGHVEVQWNGAKTALQEYTAVAVRAAAEPVQMQ